MPKFLNTKSLKECILKLIDNAECELVILVPYIKTSDRLYSALKKANHRDVEVVLIYREESLPTREKQKLLNLNNLNLMHHPNLHAKCYLNERELIITSMNMYEYSEENNREMGVLFNLEDLERSSWGSKDDFYEDAITEIQAIVNGAEMERISKISKEEGFEFEILKTKKELCEDMCYRLNETFIHKKFVPQEINGEYTPFCKNFIDNLDLHVDYRFTFQFTYPESRIEQIFNRFKPHYNEFLFDSFKFYWNHHKLPIYLYVDSNHIFWSNDNELEKNHKQLKKGFSELTQFLKQFI